MVVIIYDPSASSGQLIGVGLTLAGIVCCAVYSVVTRRWIPDAKETSQVVLSQQAHALVLAIGLVLVVGLAGGQVVPTALTPLGLASAIGSGVLYYAGAYWFYLGALRHVPASYRGRVVLSDPDRRRRRRRRFCWASASIRVSGSARSSSWSRSSRSSACHHRTRTSSIATADRRSRRSAQRVSWMRIRLPAGSRMAQSRTPYG